MASSCRAEISKYFISRMLIISLSTILLKGEFNSIPIEIRIHRGPSALCRAFGNCKWRASSRRWCHRPRADVGCTSSRTRITWHSLGNGQRLKAYLLVLAASFGNDPRYRDGGPLQCRDHDSFAISTSPANSSGSQNRRPCSSQRSIELQS